MDHVSVFLVEDSALLRKRLESLLAAVPDARIVGQASGAQEAISGILATRPDVVVLDLSLQPGSGFDVLSAVRQGAPDTDVYVLSNFASVPYQRQAYRLGAKDFFDKTRDFERVRDVIAQRALTH